MESESNLEPEIESAESAESVESVESGGIVKRKYIFS